MKYKDELSKIALEIREIISQKQKELELSFVEDTHTYYIKTKSGEITSKYPSVSTVIKQFYNEFPEHDISYSMSNNDIFEQDRLLKEWRAEADYANNKGSRVHYLLEKDLLAMYGSYKEVRKPIFQCDETQIEDGNRMIDAGHDFIRTMHRRGAVLLDTEMILGSNDLEYTGQPDKVWLMFNDDNELGFVITDWKTNKEKNFEIHHYTEPMLPPFEDEMDTALSHYKIQLPLYARLILDMLKGSKYENMKLFGCIIVHLNKDGKFNEIRVPKKFIERVMTMEPLPRIKQVFEQKRLVAYMEKQRLERLNNYDPNAVDDSPWFL